MSKEVAVLLELQGSSPNGLTGPELLANLRERFPPASAERCRACDPKAGDTVREEGASSGRRRAQEDRDERAEASSMRRFVVFDGQSIVRPIVTYSYKEQHWFLTEQREEVSSMSALLAVVERAAETNLLLAEDYLARNAVGDQGAPEAGAPQAAGGAL